MLEELADRGGVGLTSQAVAIDRALAAVAAVNDTINKMGSTGELKARALAQRLEPLVRRSVCPLYRKLKFGRSGGEVRQGWRVI
jgi:hypothetical protein